MEQLGTKMEIYLNNQEASSDMHQNEKEQQIA